MATDAIPQTPQHTAPLSIPPPRPVKPPGSPDKFSILSQAPASPDKVIVFSPYQPYQPKQPSIVLGNDAIDPPSEELQEAAEKTNHWVSLFFAGAIVLVGLAFYASYVGLKERVIAMAILPVFLAIIVEIIGIAGMILQQSAKVEPAIVPQAEKAAPVVLREGFFPGIDNSGNTCFINAPTQAIMNDSKYPEVYKEICQKAKKRHEIFKKFLELYPSQSPYAISIPKLFSRTNATSSLAVEHMRDVLIMLTMRRSSFIKNPEQFLKKYPRIYQSIEAFSKITKDAEFPIVLDADPELRAEFGLMMEDQEIVLFFYQERSRIANELLGFEAYLFLLQAYQEAVAKKSALVSFRRGYVGSYPIGDIRYLITGAEGSSQEDPDEFLRCLFKYAQREDYPDVFFPTYCECTWAECPEADQNPEELRKRWEKHLDPKHEGDLLTRMPPNKTIREAPSYSSILKIDSLLREGVSGQTLIEETFHKKNTDTTKGATFYLDAKGRVKMYYRVEEKMVIPPGKMPQKLILLLGRYVWITSEKRSVKLDCTVNMPEQIKIGGHYYQLNSVVVHSPLARGSATSAESGHYHAVVKKQDQWLSASDDKVLEAEKTHLRHALGHGSLYFYEKVSE